MYTVLYILNTDRFREKIGDEILSLFIEDSIAFRFEDKEIKRSYVLIPCDSTNYGDNLEEVLKSVLDSKKARSVAKKIRKFALDVIEI